MTKDEFVAQVKEKSERTNSVRMTRVGLGPWSPSKEKLLSQCPFQFYLKYILKIKVPPILGMKSDPLSAEVGKAAHRVLEFVMLGDSIGQAFDKAKVEFLAESPVLTEDLWREKVSALEYQIHSFQERISAFKVHTPIKQVFTERNIGITSQWTPTEFFANDVWYRGVVDLILLLTNNDIIIIDHKTGGGQGSVKNYAFQLDRYKALFHHGVAPINGAQSGIHFIGEGSIKMGTYSGRDEIESQIVERIKWEIDGAIESVVSTGYFKHVRGNYCKWCDFDGVGCKDKSLLPVELGTKKFFKIEVAKG